tara:strand:+ start:4141 stop:4587 length:447 start_codon:yes stop_codon:yes gene_type:complete
MNSKAALAGHELPKNPTPVAPPETQAVAALPNVSARDLARIFMTADDATKKVISKALNLPQGGIKKKTRNKQQRNRGHLEAMRSQGEAWHEDSEDGTPFLPVPPEGIMERGEEAVTQWHQAWIDGKTFSASSMDIDEDLANVALMAFE